MALVYELRSVAGTTVSCGVSATAGVDGNNGLSPAANTAEAATRRRRTKP
ncbi:hypothetical protein ABZ614_26050 [Streptomyces sp. NPDC013178]